MRKLQIRLLRVNPKHEKAYFEFVELENEDGKSVDIGEWDEDKEFRLLKLPGLTDGQHALCLELCKWALDEKIVEGRQTELVELHDALKGKRAD